MAPGNDEHRYLDAPWVNMHILKTDNSYEDRLVRMVCKPLEYDIVHGKFETSDKDELIANLQLAYRSVDGNKFQARPFKLKGKYYVLEGISRDSGRTFVLMRPPQPLDIEGMIDVLNDIAEFMNNKEWLEARGVVPPDPRLDHEYDGEEKPPLLNAMAPMASLSRSPSLKHEDGGSEEPPPSDPMVPLGSLSPSPLLKREYTDASLPSSSP
ncbi:hypothetical protein NP233_g11941 [Leucocoprinus birnbaumii]|uniref:Uncharacterized protein n=1 Tax=Leucocoprinus birnbaumii TaxID=56174 RepID=A0AAD5VG16_9AGAR|nr:hypothetical protein NP233_g11941 [Leucocoprinus birnbaumii]